MHEMASAEARELVGSLIKSAEVMISILAFKIERDRLVHPPFVTRANQTVLGFLATLGRAGGRILCKFKSAVHELRRTWCTKWSQH